MSTKLLTKDQLIRKINLMIYDADQGKRPSDQEYVSVFQEVAMVMMSEPMVAMYWQSLIPLTAKAIKDLKPLQSKKKFPRCAPCRRITTLKEPSKGVHPPRHAHVRMPGHPPGYRTDYVTYGVKKLKYVTIFLIHETGTNQKAEETAKSISEKIAFNIELAKKNFGQKRWDWRRNRGWQSTWNRAGEAPNPDGEGVKFSFKKGVYKGGSKEPVWTKAQKAQKARLERIKKQNPKKKWKKDPEAKTRYKQAVADLKKLRKTVKATATEFSYTYWNPGHNVHFWTGRDGQVWQGCALDEGAWHGSFDGPNWHGVGMEVCNMSYTGVSKMRKFIKRVNHHKILNNKGNVGKNMLPASQFGGGGLHYPGFREVIPGEIQCRRAWEVILFLMSPANPFKNLYYIPVAFPGTANAGIFNSVEQNGLRLGTGFNSPLGGGKPIFIWRRMKATSERSTRKARARGQKAWGDVESVLKGGALRWWRKGVGGPDKKPTNHWHHGILSHMRWETHNDGQQVEYYCLGRALGLSSNDAYYAMIGALSTVYKDDTSSYISGWNKKYPQLDTGYTYFPDAMGRFYVKLGKKLWGTNGPLNWYQEGSDYVPGKKLYSATYRVARQYNKNRSHGRHL